MGSEPDKDHTMKLGLLMEAALAHQQAVDDGLRRLQEHTDGLDAVVRDQIRRTLAAELEDLTMQSTQAAGALQALKRSLNLRGIGWSVLIGTLPSLIAVVLVTWWLPSPQQTAVIRERYEQLAATVGRLEQSGGRADLRRCGDRQRLCVRVDKTAPAYGTQADYFIVGGY